MILILKLGYIFLTGLLVGVYNAADHDKQYITTVINNYNSGTNLIIIFHIVLFTQLLLGSYSNHLVMNEQGRL